ncbi:MAG TPA: bifunctional alpha/beta hydrolase/OsmC family protein [Gemmatimonadaceae bacterium]|nr:bifunctional alpha/beta hydrolase/OsmC family protein [Gemmatimonadaceae bacterium]
MTRDSLVVASAGGRALTLRLALPADGAPVAWALFAHCFTCPEGVDAAARIARALAAERIAVARLDLTGRDEGAVDAPAGVAAEVADLEAVAAALAEAGRAPELLVGHSLGGSALLLAARAIPSARAVATIATPLDAVAHPGFDVPAALRESLRLPRVADALRESRLPLLVLHSPVDEVVPLDDASALFTAARHPKSFVSLDDADHMLTRPRDAAYAADVVASWVRRYVDVQPHRPLPELEAGTGVVARTGADGLRTELLAGGHPLVADEPASVGGTETGPTPYDLLAAALAACTSMTLQMDARRKGWPLEDAIVRATHRKIHALDESTLPEGEPRLDQIERSIELTGDLTDEQRARLAEIADRCPVHRTLERGVKVD